MSFAIVSDSCSNLLDETIEKYDITILPLTFLIDDVQYTSYNKGEKTDLQKFYKMLRDGKVITTSLPNLQDSKRALTEILEGGSDILYIGFSSNLSGTYTANDLIAKELSAQFPDRKILTVDTLAASMGEGFLVWEAASMREEGKSIEEVHEWLETNKLKVAHWFTVDDLMFLWRGGRVSKTAAFAGSMLNIKPVLHVDDEGHLIPMEKVRGRKKSIDALVDHMEKTVVKPYNNRVLITHGDCIDDALSLKEKIEERFDIHDIHINYVDPVVGAHSGPGTLALFYLADSRN